MKLYYGGCGDYKVFTVAENLDEAKKKLGVKIGAPFLPIEADEISTVDGYSIVSLAPHQPAEAPKTPEKRMMHCKKCDFETDNLGEMGKHYREFHPKGG